MNCKEAIQEIIEVIPDAQYEFKNPDTAVTPYKLISVFTGQIKKLITTNDQLTLKKCLQKMNKLYSKGDPRLKNAIENTFIYSLDTFTFRCEPKFKEMIFKKLSLSLQNNYLHQVYKSGI